MRQSDIVTENEEKSYTIATALALSRSTNYLDGMRVVVLSTMVLVGCVRLPDAPTLLSDDRDFAAPVVAVPEGISDDPPVEFRLAPGDVVTLRTMSTENRSYEDLIVDERGLVHVPLCGDVEVGGLALTAAETRIETALREFDRVVRVSVVLQDQGGHLATVLGAVEEPGRIPVAPGMRLADLVAAVGGPVLVAPATEISESADLSAARLLRGGAPLPVSVDLAMRGDPRHNVRVRAGDHLYVPWTRGATVTVLGEVVAPAILGYRGGIRLTAALALAGGLAPDAHRSDIRVVRGSLEAPRVYRTSLRALVDGEGRDIELAPGDIVFVTRTRLAGIHDVMNAMQPLLFTAQNVGLAVGISQSTR